MPSNCCAQPNDGARADLLIVGGGSAAFSAAIRSSELGRKVTIINEGLPIGGTCVNVGCVPSKTLIRAAEAYHRARHPHFEGISSQATITDFGTVIAQKRQLVQALRQSKYVDIASGLESVRIIEGRARLQSPNSVVVNGEQITADRILIATGASPSVPRIPGLENVPYVTNETLFELEELPESLIVVGAGYVALESAQMFARFGSRVTILQRSSRILKSEAPDLTDALTGYLDQEGITVLTHVAIRSVRKDRSGAIIVEATVNGKPDILGASHILVAAGRTPKTTALGLEQVGVQLDARGFLSVDETLQTSVPGIYGAGDVIGAPMYVYTAAYEGALAAENALTGASKTRDYSALPWVVFTDPQVAGVGFDEHQAREHGFDPEVSVVPLSAIPRSLAARDTRGFVKLVRDRATDKILGARILAPEGSELLLEVSLAVKYGITAKELATTFHPYLTLSEGIKLAAIGFGKDVKTLSCCAA